MSGIALPDFNPQDFSGLEVTRGLMQQRPAFRAPAPECEYVTTTAAKLALARLQASLPSTEFTGARPSVICGMVAVQMKNGKKAYTDVTGRFLLLAFALDTHNGSPADTQSELDSVLETRDSP